MNFASLILAAIVLLMAGGCSKKSSATKDTPKTNDSDIGDSVTKFSKTQPTLKQEPDSVSISRQADGLWHESGTGKIFTGRVVYGQDTLRWEEKYEQGVRVFVRAWDEEGDPVELHAWNPDGSPKN
jgi:hypothetical protein